MFDKQCKCLQEIKERKQQSSCKSFISYSLSSTALIHSPAMRLQLQRRTLSLSLFLVLSITSLCSLLLFLSLCCQLFPFDVAFIVTDSFFDALCVWKATHTHRQTHNTHAQQKKMQRILNAICESTRRPNFTYTHTHTHEIRVQVRVCVYVIQVTVFMLSLFIHIFNTNNKNWLSC